MSPAKKIFHSRLPKTSLNGISFTFLCYSKTSDLHLVLEYFFFIKKNCIKKELCKKSFENELCGNLHTGRKGSTLLLPKLYKSNFYLHQQRSSSYQV